MIVHTPASLRALRETVGYTRAELARVLHVDERSVRRWESPTNPTDAPPGVWEWLEGARADQLARVDAAADVVEVYAQGAEPPACVELPYYVNQEHYEATRRDEPADEEAALADRATVANATTRELASRLVAGGVSVRFAYPRPSAEGELEI